MANQRRLDPKQIHVGVENFKTQCFLANALLAVVENRFYGLLRCAGGPIFAIREVNLPRSVSGNTKWILTEHKRDRNKARTIMRRPALILCVESRSMLTDIYLRMH